MTEEEREFIKRVNVDKANNKTIVPIILMILSIGTYVIPLFLGNFDFGIIFEITSLVFLIISKKYMSIYDESRARIYIICAIASIGWILIYDVITLCFTIQNLLVTTLFAFEYFLLELFSIVYVIILFKINKDLAKAENPEKYREKNDFFYENYKDKEEI